MAIFSSSFVLKQNSRRNYVNVTAESARGLTSVVVSNNEYAVYKGTDNDDPILNRLYCQQTEKEKTFAA